MAKYSKGAGKKVEEAVHEQKEGKLKSGRSGKKVTSRKQAIAIGLSEAREKGEKVPAKKGASKKTASKKGATKKTSAKKGGTKKGAASKKSTKSSSAKKAGAKKSAGGK
jgi:topoisomerase IA-like protein